MVMPKDLLAGLVLYSFQVLPTAMPTPKVATQGEIEF